MNQLNKKYYTILNNLHNKIISIKDISHDDLVVLIECGYLRRDIPGIISSKGLPALDEYRALIKENKKSTIILIISIITAIISILSLLINILMAFKK